MAGEGREAGERVCVVTPWLSLIMRALPFGRRERMVLERVIWDPGDRV